MRKYLFASTAMLILAAAGTARAEDNMQKLENMQATGTGSDAFQFVPQNDENAAQLRKNLEKIKLPDGFKINLYAVVPDARHMAVGPQGIVTFVGTRKDAVWAITDRNKDGTADEVKRFAPSLDFAIPNGVCFSKDGFLYIAERNRIRVFPAAEFFYESPDVATGDVVKEGELIPGGDESFNHTARVCAVGPDKKLYVQIGQPFNVPPPDRQEEFRKTGIGGIIRMDQNGANREIYADGLRNPVGFDFDPATGDLWTNDNQVDGMGDDIPPGELNHVTEMGQNFGFPWYGGALARIPEQPRPMLVIERGGTCLGMAFRLPDQGRQEQIYRMVYRETEYRGDFDCIRWISADTAEGGIRALAFWAAPSPNFPFRQLTAEETARRIARACGHLGSNAAYLYNTVAKLEEIGIRDRNLWRLQHLVAEEIRRLTDTTALAG